MGTPCMSCGNIAGEISRFLSDNGIEHEVTIIDGMPLLRTSHGADILPLTIDATDPAAATECRKAAERLIGHMEKRPLVIAQDRWIKDGEIFRKRLLAHLGRFRHIYARNCEVRRIRKDVAEKFMDACHSYGSAVSRYRYGLFLKKAQGGADAGTMVAAATFSNGRLMPRNGKVYRSFQWIRYASVPDIRAVGGMGKIIRHFISEDAMQANADDRLRPDFGGWDIMTYADLEWSDGRAYRETGFRAEGMKSPVMYAVSTEDWHRRPLSRIHEERHMTGPDVPADIQADMQADIQADMQADMQEDMQADMQEGAPQWDTLFIENFGSIRYRLLIPYDKKADI